MWRLMKAIVEMKSDTEKKIELKVVVQSWIHEVIEQMIRASGTKFSGGVFKFHHSRQLSIATSKNRSVVNTI